MGEGDLMGDDDHCHSLAGELLDDPQHFADQLGVKRRGDLVAQHYGGAHRQGPCDRYALALTAGEMRGIGVGLVAEPDLFEQAAGNVLRLASRNLFDDRRPGHDVAERRHVREQVEVLKDHAGRRTKRRQLAVGRLGAAAVAEVHLALPDADPPAIRLLQQVDAAQQRRFSGAARSDDRDDRAALDPQ